MSAKVRDAMLREIISAGFHGVDLETGSDRALLRELGESKERPLTIASAHFSDPAPESMIESTLSQACMLGDVGKVAMTCENAPQAIMLANIGLKFAARGKRFVIIGMGDQGRLTRVCASKIGSSMIYACVDGKEAAPGQLDVATQKSMDGRHTVLGLVGHPVSHSVSKQMQEAALEGLGIAGAYVPLDFPPGTFDHRAVSALTAIGFFEATTDVLLLRDELASEWTPDSLEYADFVDIVIKAERIFTVFSVALVVAGAALFFAVRANRKEREYH